MSAATDGNVYLRSYLAPLAPWLERSDVTDVLINRPGEVWFETRGGALECSEAPFVTASMLQRLAQQVAASTHQGVNREHPLLSATLPGGARIQIASPPATRAHFAIAIRKHDVGDLSLADYETAGAFANVRRLSVDAAREHDAELDALLERGELGAFFREAVRRGKNILVSGGTGSGKTTFLNALLKEVQAQDRIIVIEDTPEIHVSQPNAVGLVAVRGELGEARVGMEELLQAALRMRPDRLLVGEIRGVEAISFLRAINTGHPGSMTTIHADSPQGAFDQIALMAMQARVNLSRDDVLSYARSVIDIVVQLTRVGGKRRIEGVSFTPRT